jgi:hypothetical protein
MAMSLKKYNQEWLGLVREICWAQWNRLGLLGTGPSNLYSTDIESALLLSAHILRHDGRLLHGVRSWLLRYEDVINVERLSTLIRHYKNETLARVIGGLIDSPSLKSMTSCVRTCRKLCSKEWAPIPLLLNTPQSSWKTLDKTWQSWGFFSETIESSSKIKDHDQVLRDNTNIQYRYLYGTSARADILYLLSISETCRNKSDIDFLTAIRLSECHLGCNYSTIKRIQWALEEGNFLVPQRKLRNRGIVTWVATDKSIFLKTKTPDKGLIRWLPINDLLFSILNLRGLIVSSSEDIFRFAVNEFHEKWFPILEDHTVSVPVPYGKNLFPLKERTAADLCMMTTVALKAFLNHITNIKN